MEIDSLNGVAYIQEANGDMHHEICPEESQELDLAE